LGAIISDAVDQTTAAPSEVWSCPKRAGVDAWVCEDGIGGAVS